MKKTLTCFRIILFFAYPFLLLSQAFTDVSIEAGLDVVSKNNGVAVADYDNDGDLDLFFTGFYSYDANDETTWNRLMRNNGNGTFDDVTMEAGFTNQFVNTDITASLGEKMGASWGDYDNDGFADIFLTNSRLDQLYHNNGDGTFTEVTEAAGVEGCNNCYSGGGTWFDHDRDGLLDLYVSVLNGDNIFYRNKGDGTFENLTAFYKLEGTGVTWTTAAIDIGKDGFLDLYCANDTQINECFENRSGVHYNEVSRAYRIADPGAGMGMTIGDYNNDGYFDVYVTNIYNHYPNPLFKNSGQRRYLNVADRYGIENTGWGWGVQFFDFDHDFDEDLFAVNGVVSKQSIDGFEQTDEPHYFYKNTLIENGKEGFVNWSQNSNMDLIDRSRGLEVFDYDADGDLDVVIANVETIPNLFKNETINQEEKNNYNNWLQVELEGTLSNRNAFGTEVKITFSDQSLYRWHHGTSFFGQSIKPLHFGLGQIETVDEIQVTWLSGEVQHFYNIPVNQKIKLVEGNAVITNTLETIKSDLKVKTSPNPSRESILFEINSKEKGPLDIQIFNASGVLVDNIKREKYSNEVLLYWNPGSDLVQGVYFYKVRMNQVLESGKILRF